MTQFSSKYNSQSYYQDLRRPVEEAITLNPEAYRCEEFFLQEQQFVFSKSWVCVAHTSQFKENGSLVPVQVANQPILLCKNNDQEIRGFYNVCRHRGSLLVTKETKAEKIRCPYHSWTYDLNGNLRACPLFRQETESFSKEEYSLLSVRVEIWGCFVFVNLDKEAMSLSQYLGDFIPDYANFPFSEVVHVRRKKYEIQANWKLVAENFLEYYHLPWVHPELCNVTAIDMHKRNQGKGMYMSFFAYPLLEGGTPLDAGFLPDLPGLSEKEGKAGFFPLLFPNLAMFIMPHHIFSLTMHPTTPQHTEEFADLFIHPNLFSISNLDVKLDEIFSFYDMVNIQDVKAVELVQKGINAKAYQGGRLSYRFEEPLHRFQNILADFMLAKPIIPEGDLE